MRCRRDREKRVIRVSRLVGLATSSIGRLKLTASKSGFCSIWGRSMAAQPQPGPVSLPLRVEIRDITRRKRARCTFVGMQGHAELLEVIDALGAPGSFAGGLNGGQQQGDQDADDADDHEQFDQSEGKSLFHRAA